MSPVVGGVHPFDMHLLHRAHASSVLAGFSGESVQTHAAQRPAGQQIDARDNGERGQMWQTQGLAHGSYL